MGWAFDGAGVYCDQGRDYTLHGESAFNKSKLEEFGQAFDCEGEGGTFGEVRGVIGAGLLDDREDATESRVVEALVVVVPIQQALFGVG